MYLTTYYDGAFLLTTAIGLELSTNPLVSLRALFADVSLEKVTNACPFILPSFIRRISNLIDKRNSKHTDACNSTDCI